MPNIESGLICAFTAIYLIALGCGIYCVFASFFKKMDRFVEATNANLAKPEEPEPEYNPFAMSQGLEMIHTERMRQIAFEGFSAEHDDKHGHGELAKAAACYAMHNFREWHDFQSHGSTSLWPFTQDEFKASDDDQVRNLVKAGALIAAEIDRLMRWREKNAELLASIKLRASMMSGCNNPFAIEHAKVEITT